PPSRCWRRACASYAGATMSTGLLSATGSARRARRGPISPPHPRGGGPGLRVVKWGEPALSWASLRRCRRLVQEGRDGRALLGRPVPDDPLGWRRPRREPGRARRPERLGRAVLGLLVSDLRPDPSQRAWPRGGPGPDAGLLLTRAGEGRPRGRRPA